MYKSSAQTNLEQQFPSILEALSSWLMKPSQNNRGTVSNTENQLLPTIVNGKLVTNDSLQDMSPLVALSKYVPSSPIKNTFKPIEELQPIKSNMSMQNLAPGVGYVNGKLFDSNKQPINGIFDGYSKERDAALDSYGKVDKNSEFYKRNKKAMDNLGKPIIEESEAQQQNNAIISGKPISASIDFKSLGPNKPRKIYGVY